MTRHWPRLRPRLHPDGELFELVAYLLRKYWSHPQIARTLKVMFPDGTQLLTQVSAILEGLQVDVLIFHATPEPLDEILSR
ncbi:hypothetical protein GCM10007159_41430 [Modicisalibacter luteus]|nr:hypothetical protein GCM10007159_41430 [Halomonas lutea]